ncbi:MAG: ferrous iron transport protein B [Candidatus Rifleibacteriota bacterium]
MKNDLVIALAGNPNSGKTTIFNELTGSRQHVGNYPGVTVEYKEGFCKNKEKEIKIVDLPGTYSLTAYSSEELVARNFLIEQKPDVVIDVLDSSNLERNLYLAVQLKELNIPLILAFNMSDMAKGKGYEFNLEKLSKFFDAGIVETTGHKSLGMNQLIEAAIQKAENGKNLVLKMHGKSKKLQTGENAVNSNLPFSIKYGKEIDQEIEKIEALIPKDNELSRLQNNHWLALKLLENDADLLDRVKSEKLSDQITKSSEYIEEVLGETPEIAIAGARYGFISGACQQAVRSTIEIRHSISDQIDSIATHKVLGLPIFLGLMYLVFHLTFTFGEAPMGWIESFFAWFSSLIQGWWPANSESLVKSLLIDGIIGGVGGVIIFLPNILFLFLAIAILEDSGYMARVAFIMDHFMRKIGLHGKSFIPMLIGFGCSVPAIMATRTLDNRRDRLATMMVVPLMSCGARLPIYALIIPAFFPQAWHAPMMWLIYMIGILLAVVVAKLLRVTILKGESVPFVMELPPYRIPTIKGIFIHMWERGWLYLKKAGTIILAISIVLWALTTFPQISSEKKAEFQTKAQRVQSLDLKEVEKKQKLQALENQESETALRNSFAGKIGLAMEPVLKPMGFDWRIGTALIGAFAAKEVFVAQMGIVYSVGEAEEDSKSLRDKLKEKYNPLIGFCIMLFCLISAPCMATIAITKRESNSWFWALFQLGGLTIMAYVVTVIVYQVGMFFQIGIN